MALTFNGNTANYAQTAISFSAGKGTVMGWVRLASDRNDYSTFFQTNAVDNAQFVCQTNSTGTELSVYIYNSSNTGSGLTVGTWYHVAMTWDGSTARVYLNGTLNASVSATGSTWNEVELGRSYWGEPLDGNIAHIKAWDATLSQAEIAAEKDVIAAIRTTNLVGEWQTPAGANRLLDTSGNANHFTGHGTITDYANPLAAITVTDAGSGSDAVSVDTGATGSDNDVTLPDVAMGLDSLSIIKSPYYVNHATAFSGPGVTSRTCDVPGGTQDGDLMLAVVMVELASGAVTAHANWGTPILNTPLSTRTHTQVVYARVADSEPANYTFSWSSCECGVAIVTFRNAALSSLYNSQVNNSTTATCTAPSLTTVGPNSLSVWIGTIMYGTTWTPPANYDERVDQRTSTASTNMAMGIADRVIVTPGATGAIAGTAANADYNVGAHIILAPAARTLAIVDTGHGVDAVAATEASGDQTITVTDSGSGVDALAGVTVALALSDAGAGNDAFGASAAVATADTGAGSDSIAELLASLLVAENGAGADDIAQVTAGVATSDSGAGSDAVANVGVSVTAVDAGSGSDALAGLAAALGVTDAGSGEDALAGLAATLGMTDAGTGSDALGSIAASLTVADSGVGIDSPAISVTLSVADAAVGADAVLQLILVAIADAGTAVDSLAGIAVALTLPDSGASGEAMAVQVAVNVIDAGSGTEALTLLTEALKQVLDSGVGTDLVLSPAVSLTVLDSGLGADSAAVSVTLTVADGGSAVEALSVIATMLVAVLDSGSGSDALAVSVAPIVVADTGSGTDAPGIAVALTLADVAAGSDALLTSVLVTVADAAAGTDTLSSITVNVPVSDMGQAVDVLGQVNAVLSVLDVGAGVDVLVRYDSAVKLVKVVFVLARRAMAFAWRARSVTFAWSARAVEFAGPAPSIEFAWSRRTVEFVINS